jgi:hypothetical protein
MRWYSWLWLGVVACASRGGCLQPHLPDGVQVVVCADMGPDTGEEWWDDQSDWDETDTAWTSSSGADTGGWWGESDTGW